MFGPFVLILSSLFCAQAPAKTEKAPQKKLETAEEILVSLRKAARAAAPEVEEASQRLEQMGKSALPELHQALRDSFPIPVITACRVLAKIKDPSSFDVCLAAIQGNLPTEAAIPCLETLFLLDPVRSLEVSIPLLDHKSGAVRAAASKTLAGKIGKPNIPALLALTQAKRDDTRMRSFRLLEKFAAPEVFDRACEAFGDLSPEVCSAAVESTARYLDPAASEKLKSLVLNLTQDRSWSYACLALARRLELGTQKLNEPDSLELSTKLLPLLNSKEPFLAGCVAVLLAQLGYHQKPTLDSSFLDKEVPDVLVQSVSRSTFYKDFSSLLQPALRQLQLLSGEIKIRGSSDWASWWLVERKQFRANRAFFSFGKDQESKLAFDWFRMNGSPRLISFRGTEVLANTRREEFVLSSEDLREFMNLLLESGVLEDSSTEANAEKDQVSLRFGRQKKTFWLDERAAWTPQIRQLLLRFREQSLWQLFPDLSKYQNKEEYRKGEFESWQQEKDPKKKKVRLKISILRALPLLQDPEKIFGLDLLIASPEVIHGFSKEDVVFLLTFLRMEETTPGVLEKVLDVLAVTEDQKVLIGVVDLLVEKFDVASKSWLLRAFRGFEKERISYYLGDTRPVVRAAAIESLSRFPASEVTGSLLPMLNDPDANVQRSAVFALGLMKSPEALKALFSLAEQASSDLRKEICLAVGRIGGEDAFSFLVRHGSDPSLEVQEAALRGIAELGGDQASGVLTEIYLQNRGGNLSEIAREQILARDPRSAKSSLKRRLQQEDIHIKKKSALLLAELFDTSAIPVLLEILKASPKDQKALDALYLISGEDYSVDPDPLARYSEWWERSSAESQTKWFWKLAIRSGMEVSEDLDSVPYSDGMKIVELLNSKDWVLRTQTGHWLREITGKNFGTVTRYTSKVELDRISMEYKKYLSTHPESPNK